MKIKIFWMIALFLCFVVFAKPYVSAQSENPSGLPSKVKSLEKSVAVLIDMNTKLMKELQNQKHHFENELKKQKLFMEKEQAYFFYGATATPSKMVAEIVIKGNYRAFCDAIGKQYTRHISLGSQYNPHASNGYFYQGWYYTGKRYGSKDHVYHAAGNDPNENNAYNAWIYNSHDKTSKTKHEGTCCINRPAGSDNWSLRASAIIFCK